MAEEEVVVEQRATWMGRNALIALTTDGEMIARFVALIVTQNIGKVVGALLRETDDALFEIGMEDGQSHTWFAE